jgi:hypothetical protein
MNLDAREMASVRSNPLVNRTCLRQAGYQQRYAAS